MIPVVNDDFIGEGLGYLTSEYSGENAPQLQALISAFLAEIQLVENALWQAWNMRQLANLIIYNPPVGTFHVINGFQNVTATRSQTGVLIPFQSIITFASSPSTSYLIAAVSSNGLTITLGASYFGTTATATTATQNLTNALMDTVGNLVGQPRLGQNDLNYLSTIYLRIAVNRSYAVPPNWSNFAAILLQTSGGPADYWEGDAAFRLSVYDMTLNPIAVATVLAGAVGNGILGQFGYSTWPDGNDFSFTSRYSSGAGEAGWGSRYDSGVGGLLVALSDLPPG